MLSACGGGGGGSPPSTDSSQMFNDILITPAQQAAARAELALLREEVANSAILDLNRTDLLQEIEDLAAEIENVRRRFAELEAEIARLWASLIAASPPPPDPEPPTTPNCEANERAEGQDCVCVDGFVRNAGGMCVLRPPPPVAECTDFRVRGTDGECTYDTPEYRRNAPTAAIASRINVLYAYERGYHGQSVTVAVGEQVSRTHENLRANVLTMDIGLNCRNHVYTGKVSAERAANFTERNRLYNCDRFNEANATVLASIFGTEPERYYENFWFHGNGAAGLIAAPRNGIVMHGVAPRSKMIPIPDTTGFRWNNDTSDLEYIIDNQIPIVSYSIFPQASFAEMRRDYLLFADTDTVLVWASGNNGDSWRQTENHIFLPAFEKSLEDNWLVVAETFTRADRTVALPIRCGEAMMWCINAGHGGTAPAGPEDNYFIGNYGATSGATPQVAGALALLKSAANKLISPDFPMTMIRAILLTTATDLGDPGIDAEFGWGFVNISAGIRHIEEIETADGTLLRDLRGRLPAEFSHLRGRMDSVSVAVKITEDSFYNLALG
ncbi:MAG: S8 family serine peptidase, partial [Gammaproteobacteria bacterium]